MAVSWSFTMLLVVTIVALFTFSQPLFQLAIPEAVEKHTQTDIVEIVAAVPRAGHNPLTVPKESVDAGSSAWCFDMLRRGSRRSQRYYWTRKLILQRRPPCVDLQQQRQGYELPGESISSPVTATPAPRISRRSVLASFQSDRMVPTGPNPLHNSNRSQVIFP